MLLPFSQRPLDFACDYTHYWGYIMTRLGLLRLVDLLWLRDIISTLIYPQSPCSTFYLMFTPLEH